MALAVTIAGSPVIVLEGSAKYDDNADLRSTLSFIVRDDTGTLSIQPGQKVSISDATGNVFNGFVNDATSDNKTPNAMNFIAVECMSNDYLADRAFALKDFVNQYAGDIASDLLNSYLAQDGVTASYAIRHDATASQFEQGTLSGTIGATTVGDGDLELAPAGTALSYTESTTAQFGGGTLVGVTAANNSLAPTSFPILKILAAMSAPGVTSAGTFVKIWSGAQSVGSNYHFQYDLFIDPASPEAKVGLDITFSDGTTLRDTGSINNAAEDAQFILPSPANDMTGLATIGWYTRGSSLQGYSGKTIAYITMACMGLKVGTYRGYVKNAVLLDNSNSVVATFFGGTLNVNPPQQMQSYGYSDTEVSVIPGYDLYSATAPAYGALAYKNTVISIDVVKLVRSSIISWQAITPTNTTFVMKYSLDGGTSYFTCANNAPLPSLPPGLNVAGKSITLQYQYYALPGALPEVAPTLTSVSLSLLPSYAATKSDVLYNAVQPTDWTAGTPTNLIAPTTRELTLNGVIKTWDDGSVPQSFFTSSAFPLQSANNRTYTFWNVPDTTEARSELDFAGSWQNFTAEIDIKVDTVNVTYGFVYRTTNWNNNNNTFAYAAHISTAAVTLGRGSNSGSSGSFTQISTAALSLATGSWHRLKLIINGSNHKVYVDEILMLNSTDATFSAAGNIGLRVNNTNSGTGNLLTMFFDNFGVVASLIGTWVSPATSLTSAGTYGTSIISWRDKSLSYNGLSNTSDLIEASIDGGTTWQTCSNNSAIPNFVAGQSLSGVNLLIRATLSSSTASSLAAIDNLHAYVLGAYSASGNRISPALALTAVGRAGSTLINWDANVPANTSLFLDSSLDATNWTNAGSGASGSAPIAGITVQGALIDDTFTTNTSSLYIATHLNADATWTWDTANSRVTATGGNNALLEYIGLSATDIDVMMDMDEADNGGVIARVSGTTMYALYLYDSQATTFGIQNTYFVYAIVSGSFNQLATGPISFTRGTPHRYHLLCVGSTITATMDGTTLYSGTDTHISSPGTAGLLAGSLARFYQFRAQPLGQSVVGMHAYTKVRMTSTDPTVTPQLTDLTLSVLSPNIQNGALIPAANYSLLAGNKKTLAACFDDLVKQSGNFVWGIGPDLQFIFRAKNATPSPWIATGADIQLSSPPTVKVAEDLYRNKQFGTGAIDTVTFSKSFAGDGQTQTWTLDFPVQSLTSVTINGVPALIGIKGVDTGKGYYYTVGSPVVSQDASASALVTTQTVTFTYVAQTNITVDMRDDTAIALRASLDGTTGIVQEVEDCTGLTKTAAITKVSGLLQQYAPIGKTFSFTTMRSGLASNQILTVFLPQLGIFDGQFLITDVTTTWKTTMANNVEVAQPFYAVQVTSGAVVGDYTRFLSNIAKGAGA